MFLKLYEKHGKVHAIIRHRMRHLELSGTDNLRFDKKAISTFYFSTGYFIKEIETYFSLFPYVIETLVKVWENSKYRGNTSPIRIHVPAAISRSPIFHSCFYNCMETRKMFSIS